MICRKCQKQIPEGSLYCNHCGTKQNTARATHKPVKQRGNGQGSVYKVGDKWAAEVTLGYVMGIDGKPKRKTRKKYGFDRKKDALAYLETLRSVQEQKTVKTVSELYAMYHEDAEKSLSHSKLRAYEIAWDKIAPAVQLRKIDTLTVPELQQITDAVSSSYYTARDIKNLLSHIYRIAIRDDITDKNRAQYISLPELEQNEKTVFTEDEISVLWENQSRYIVQHILVMLYTGMRPAEVLSVKKENIHIEEHYLTGGVKTKKSKARKIIIPDKIAGIMSALIDSSKGDKLSNYVKHAFYDAWNDFKAAQGMRDELTPYCCRHTYITMLTALKVSPAMLQELAGHEDYDTTLEYTHLSIADRLAEVNRL